jgi:hypothetical protein
MILVKYEDLESRAGFLISSGCWEADQIGGDSRRDWLGGTSAFGGGDVMGHTL